MANETKAKEKKEIKGKKLQDNIVTVSGKEIKYTVTTGTMVLNEILSTNII
ncbi:MAG: hypothetical protein HN855_06940 [Anaerolineae bacterium]|jgi:hypothetical protein|nr:hypothetical protein [Anaerolineae bacterium]MBT7072640.1 hypothetical protein [Anaerolineae bacterium]MBT7324874.1 hypothetical protein [Anaerolineae bacterium]